MEKTNLQSAGLAGLQHHIQNEANIYRGLDTRSAQHQLSAWRHSALEGH